MIPAGGRGQTGAYAPWLAAAGATLATLWLFWPGYTSVDSLHQYQQALAGRYDNVHPPLFAFAWRQLARLLEGSGAMHAVLVAGFWTGLARTLWALELGARTRLVAFLAIGAWPPVLLVVAHVWKDVAMAAALLLALAAVLRARTHGRRRDPVAAVAWLALAVAMRHNAWFAVLPLLALLSVPRARPLLRDERRGERLARHAGLFAVALALLAVPRAVEALLDAERKALWPTIALWDLAAVSLSTGEVRLPREVAPTLTLEDLARHYEPWSCVPLYESGKIRLAVHSPYSEADTRAVDAAWLDAVREAPAAYVGHRARVLAGLLLRPPADAPRELVYVAEHRVEGPVRAPPAPTRALLAFAERFRATPLFAWLPYLVLALAALAAAPRGARAVPFALLASAVLYAAPLALLAGSSEFRYVHWPVVACLLAAAASLGSRSAPDRQVADSVRRE